MTNMYVWVDGTRNFIGGKCRHGCSYCYVQRLKYPRVKSRYSGKLHLIENEFKKSLGKNKTWFIGSCIDMFADDVPKEWIQRGLNYCGKFDNKYLFQSKNPKRFWEFTFPKNIILGTTIETNRDTTKISSAPLPKKRANAMVKIRKEFRYQHLSNIEIMVSIEPILDFDLDVFVNWIKNIKPKFVSIGADSKRTNLLEPSPEKLKLFISRLEKITEVRIKSNLKRLRD